MKNKNPDRVEAAQVLKHIDVGSTVSEPNASLLAAQRISRKFGLTPAVAALTARLAQLGPREENTQ